MDWGLPAAIQAFINLIALTAIGLAAFGKLKDGRFQSQKDIIQLRGEQVDALEDRVKDLTAALEKSVKTFELHAQLAEATETSLRAEISEIQRLNLNLQKQVDRHAALCPPQKGKER